jgi:hypothetical protein
MGKKQEDKIAQLEAMSKERATQIAQLVQADVVGVMDSPIASRRSKSNGQPKTVEEAKALYAPNKLKIGLADFGGGLVAQGLNEGWTFLMRMAGKWSADGFLAKQNDYLQAAMPSLGGLLWYLLAESRLAESEVARGQVEKLKAALIASQAARGGNGK